MQDAVKIYQTPPAPEPGHNHDSDSYDGPFKKPKAKFSLADLPGPPDTWYSFTDIFIPQLLDYVGCSERPWSPDGILTKAQDLWDSTFPDLHHLLREKDDPVSHLVCYYQYS